jgi:hypothetical protein
LEYACNGIFLTYYVLIVRGFSSVELQAVRLLRGKEMRIQTYTSINTLIMDGWEEDPTLDQGSGRLGSGSSLKFPQSAYSGLQRSLQQEWQFVQ